MAGMLKTALSMIKSLVGMARGSAAPIEFTVQPSPTLPGKTPGVWRFNWPHDPVYRPLIAIVSGDCVVAFGKVFREPGDPDWPCQLQFAPSAGADDLHTIICMETGESLRALGDDRYALDAPACTAFLDYLKLSPALQISMLYWALRRRTPTFEEERAAMASLAQNGASILDIRDRIVEQMLQEGVTEIKAFDRVRWLVWDGLSSILSVSTVHGSGAHPQALARLALGTGFSHGNAQAWNASHALTLPLGSRVVPHTDESPMDETVFKYRNLMAAFATGMPRGHHFAGNGIHVPPLESGHSVFGPYIRLVPGEYCLEIDVASRQGPLRQDIQVEIAYGEARVHNVFVAVPDDGRAFTATVPFMIPISAQDALTGPLFEFRMSIGAVETVLISDVRLTRLRRARPEVAMTQDLLPAVTLRPRAKRSAGTIQIGDGPPDCVFYGPYLSVLSGAYALELELSRVASSSTTWTLEVACARHGQLASISGVSDSIHRKFSLPFVLSNDEAHHFSAEGLEVRLFVQAGELAVHKLSLHHLGPADREPPFTQGQGSVENVSAPAA